MKRQILAATLSTLLSRLALPYPATILKEFSIPFFF
jgi:hypothetical protein